MTEMGAAAPPHRATILVGFDTFGLEVLRHLLKSTAPRGVLTWEEPRGGGPPSERHLQDLALLWVPDPTAAIPKQIDQEDANEGNALEMMKDLYRQIRPVEPSPQKFAAALSEAADVLLSLSSRAGRKDVLPLGLDVIVLARPTSREILGTLDGLLIPALDRLAAYANLQRGVQGAEILNFLAIYDFEHYWDERGDSIRRALYDSIEEWESRREKNQASFSRFYLVDGYSGAGIRESPDRVDEISLFIEFLLFEGQRAGSLSRLYHRAGNESPIAVFGIRLIERSAGLLAHVAAARFGIGWLEYLAGRGAFRTAVEPPQLRKRLEPFAPEALDRLIDPQSLHRDVDAAFASLECVLATLPIGLPDWPDRIRRQYEATLVQLEDHIATRARTLMAGGAGKHLSDLSHEVRAGIEEDLHDERDPVPLESVIEEIEGLSARLDQIREVIPPRPGEADELLHRIQDLHDDYARFDVERVDVERLKRWWPLFALALAAGLTPIAGEWLGNVPKPDPLRFLLTRAYEVLQWINNPLLIGASLFAGIWALGAAGLHRRIAARVDRSRRFYNDPDRGRFIDRLRGGLGPGGALRAPIDYLIDRLLYDMALSMRGEVTRELGRVLARLKERLREMSWLSEQLRGFLRMQGFAGEDLRHDAPRMARDGSVVRYAMERREDFDAMLRSNPAEPGRFRSIQTSHRPFDGWHERYSRTFLVPLQFLERLSRLYTDPFEQELAKPGTGPEQQRIARELVDFLVHTGAALRPAFFIKQQEGLPPEQRYCLLPSLWKGLPGVQAALSGLGITDGAVQTGGDGRAYVLRLRAGIASKVLLELE
jgi:hypothetical protein